MNYPSNVRYRTLYAFEERGEKSGFYSTVLLEAGYGEGEVGILGIVGMMCSGNGLMKLHLKWPTSAVLLPYSC